MAEESRQAEAALRPVGGVSEIQVVGALPDKVFEILAIDTAVRTVCLRPSQVDHIAEQRREDVEFVLQHIPAAIIRPNFVGLERDERRIRIVHSVEGADRWLYVAVKLVKAEMSPEQRDELWVSTAYPMGRSLTRLRKRATLWALV